MFENSKKQQYVLGFPFEAGDLDQVLLQLKNRGPMNLIDKYNGQGGKKEPHESPVGAMMREFREETGIDTVKEQWVRFHIVEEPDYIIWCYAIELPNITALEMVDNPADEDLYCIELDCNDLGYWTLNCASHKIVPDLTWMIPMARLALTEAQMKKINEETANAHRV
jgi:8-oxo-dGTP pyrophosphatase MutT (NUDIX family)